MFSKRNIFIIIVIVSFVITNGISFFVGHKSGLDYPQTFSNIPGLKNIASSVRVLVYGLGGDP